MNHRHHLYMFIIFIAISLCDIALASDPHNTKNDDSLSLALLFEATATDIADGKQVLAPDDLGQLLHSFDPMKELANYNPRVENTPATLHILDGAGGAVASFVLWKTYRELSRKKAGLRFIDLPSSAATLLKPAVSLAALGFAWYQVKNIITEPMRLRQQQEIDKFHAALKTHKDEWIKMLEKHVERNHDDLEKLAQEFEKELEKQRKESQKGDARLQLQHDELVSAQDTRHAIVTNMVSELREDINQLRDDFKVVGDTTNTLQANVGTAVKGFETLMPMVKQLAHRSAQELAIVRTLKPAATEKKRS